MLTTLFRGILFFSCILMVTRVNLRKYSSILDYKFLNEMALTWFLSPSYVPLRELLGSCRWIKAYKNSTDIRTAEVMANTEGPKVPTFDLYTFGGCHGAHSATCIRGLHCRAAAVLSYVQQDAQWLLCISFLSLLVFLGKRL